jgi:hypothetical protein
MKGLQEERAMKRLVIVLLALGLLVAFTGPVGAKGPPFCDNPPCDKPPSEPVGATCAETYSTDRKILLGTHDFTQDDTLGFVLTREQGAACFDAKAKAGTWTLTVEGSEPREMNVMIRDSAPGDFCGDDGYQVRQGNAVLGTWIFPGIPESTWDACGIGFVEGTDPEDEPLVFWLNARNLPKNGLAKITVTVDSA